MYQAAGIFGEFLKGYAQGANQGHQQRMEQVRQLQDMSIKFAERAENDPDPDVAQMFKQRSHDLMDESEKIRTKKTGLWNLVSKIISPQGKGDKKTGGLSDMLATTRDQDAGAAGGQGAAPGATPETPPQGSVMNVAQQYPTGPLPPTTVEGGKFVTPPAPQNAPPQIPTGQTTVQGGQFTTQQGQPQAPGAFPASQFQLRNAPPVPATPAVPTRAAPTSMADMSGLSAMQRAQYKLNTLTADYQAIKQTGSQIEIATARQKMEDASAEKKRTDDEKWFQQRAEDWAATPDAQEMKAKNRNYYNEMYSFLRYGKPIQDRPSKLLSITGRDQKTGIRYEVAYDTENNTEIGTRKEIEPTSDYERSAVSLIGQKGPDGKAIETYDQAREVADRFYVSEEAAKRQLQQQSLENARLLQQARQQSIKYKDAAQGGTLNKKDADQIMREAMSFAMQMVPLELDLETNQKTRDARAVNSWMMRYVEDMVGISWPQLQEIRRAGSPEIPTEEKAGGFFDRNFGGRGAGAGIPAGTTPSGAKPKIIPRAPGG